MKRLAQAVIGLALGIGLGLLVAWVISPVQYVDTAPNSLRADYRAAYAQGVARAYSVDGDLGRARTRLALLGLKDPVQDVSALAQRAAASGDQAGAQALAALAAALGGAPATARSATTETAPAVTASAEASAASPEPGATPTPSPSVAASAVASATATTTPKPSSTPLRTDTVVPSITPRLLATRTATPTELAAFLFVGQQQVCDSRLGQPLIQVVTESADGLQIPGVEVVVTWDNGFDHFFTGLKPDLGAGYGDFTMTNGVAYSVHLAESPSVSIDGLTDRKSVV